MKVTFQAQDGNHYPLEDIIRLGFDIDFITLKPSIYWVKTKKGQIVVSEYTYNKLRNGYDVRLHNYEQQDTNNIHEG
jgi:hypothetical protein